MLLGVGVGQACAHAQLIGSDPADGALLAAPPATLTLTFSEPVSGLVFRLTSPDGAIADLAADPQQAVEGAATPDVADGARIAVGLPGTMGPGTYSLTWRVVSQDGHPIGGGVLFSIGQASGDAAATRSADRAAPVTRIGLWSVRLLAMAGLVLGVGGAGWLVVLERRAGGRSLPTSGWPNRARHRARRSVCGVLFTGLLATPVWIAFQGLDALGEDVGALLSPAVWRAGLSATSYGPAAGIGALAMAAAMAALFLSPGRLRGLLAGVAVCLASLVAVIAGHAATAPPRLVTGPAILVHMLCALAWIGCFLPLLAALDAAPRASAGTAHAAEAGAPWRPALRVVSRVLPFVFVALAGSGLLLAIVQVQTVEALWRTAYGRVLLAKLAVVLLLVAFAGRNRFRLTKPALAGDASALRILRRSIFAELLLGILVLGILGLWRFTPPPRALAEAFPQALEHQLQADGLTATLSVAPLHAGPLSVSLRNLQSDGHPVDPLSVTIALSHPASGLGPFARDAGKTPDATFRTDGLVLPVAGTWVLRITVLVDDFHQVELTDRIDIGPPAAP